VWGAGANKVTGLTTKKLESAMAIGFAFGVEPRVLVIDKAGVVKLREVELGPKAKAPSPAEGFRTLLRVSPAALRGEKARVFIDYRDELKDKRRRVYCGPAESDQDFLSFDGTSWLDLNPKPTGADKKKLFSWKKLGGYVELRDCRTFQTTESKATESEATEGKATESKATEAKATEGKASKTTDTKEIWALGSVLRGVEKPDGSNEWKMVWLVDFGKGDEETVLYEAPLKGDPPVPATFEIPTSRRVRGKGFVVATRFAGSLRVAVLDTARKLQGELKTYPGWPTMPDFATSADELVLTTGIGLGADKSLKALRISRETLELPKNYGDITIQPMDTSGDAGASFTAPELAVDAKGQRWLGYIEGPKDRGQLRIVPLGKDLQPVGRSFSVTSANQSASEVRIQTLDDGRLVVAYLRDTDGKTELVTEELGCEVKR